MSAQKLTGKQCVCTACNGYFNSETAFLLHRVGKYERGDQANSRRCLTPAEMLAKGMGIDKAGAWIKKPRDAVTIPREAPPSGEAPHSDWRILECA